MNSYLPSKGDLLLIKQVPYWPDGTLKGGYIPTGEKLHPDLKGHILEVAGGVSKEGEFTLVDNRGRHIGPTFPNDSDYFEVVFTV